MNNSATESGTPLVPIVRSLLKYPLDSPEFEDAASCAGPEEIAFAREIIDQQLAAARRRKAATEERMAELREMYPGIGDAA